MAIDQINFFLNQCFSFISNDIYLEQILVCFSLFSSQTSEFIKNIIDLNFPLFEYLVDFLFSYANNFEFILDSISSFAQKNSLFHDNILSVLLPKGGCHSILRLMIKTQINESKVFSFSNFLYSLSLFPIHVFEAFDDIFECIDTVLQSSFASSFLRIAQTVKNLLFHLLDPVSNQNDNSNITNNASNQNSDEQSSFTFIQDNGTNREYDDFNGNDDDINDDENQKFDQKEMLVLTNDTHFGNYFSDDKIDYIIDSFNNQFILENLFSKIDDNEDLIKYVCIATGLLRYRCNINDRVDLQKIVDLIDSTDDEVVICSSRCFSDFCYLDPSYSANFFTIDYYINLIKKFDLFSKENKINASFQIVILSHFLSLSQLFELCKDDPDNEICLMPVFAQITCTLSVFLLDILLKLILNIIDFSVSINEEEKISKDELIDALTDIQSSDIFFELEQTKIPEMINMILNELNQNPFD